jgi:hypothetical protein
MIIGPPPKFHGTRDILSARLAACLDRSLLTSPLLLPLWPP